MNSRNSKTSDPYRVLLNLLGKINFNKSNKYVALSNLSIYHKWENIKKPYKNKFKISASTRNGKFELPGVSCSVSDIQCCFE